MKNVAAWVVEVLLWFFYVGIGLVGYFFPLKFSQSKMVGAKTLVVVHAWQTTSLPYFGMKHFFERRGHDVYFPDFGFHMGDIEVNSLRLARYIQGLQSREVVLVGVSVGALIALKYLNTYGFSRVEKFISVGGPFKGTEVARLAIYSKAGRQMLPKSDFLLSLKEISTRDINRVICIRAESDEFVSKESSCLASAIAIEVNVVGHVRLQFSKHTFTAIDKLMNG